MAPEHWDYQGSYTSPLHWHHSLKKSQLPRDIEWVCFVYMHLKKGVWCSLKGWCPSLSLSPAAGHWHKLVSAPRGREAKSTCRGWVDWGALWVRSSRLSFPACLLMLKHCRQFLGLPYLPHKLLSGGVLGWSLTGLWLSSEFSVCREGLRETPLKKAESWRAHVGLPSKRNQAKNYTFITKTPPELHVVVKCQVWKTLTPTQEFGEKYDCKEIPPHKKW